MQRRHGQRPLTKAECRQLAWVFKRGGIGQCARCALQAGRKLRGRAEAECLCHFADALCPQQAAQLDEIGVAALFQRAAQVDHAVGAAQCTAVSLPGSLDLTRAVVGVPVKAALVGGCSQHDLEHRPGTECAERSVEQRGIVGGNAGGDILRVKRRHTDRGKHLAGGRVHHDKAAARQIQRGQPLTGALQVGVQRQPHALPRAGCFHRHKRACVRQQASLRGHKAGHNARVSGGGQQVVVGFFQAGHAATLAVQIAQQVRGGAAAEMLRHGAGRDALRGQVAVHLYQKGACKVAALIQKALLRIRDIRKQRRVPGVSGQAECVIPRGKAGQPAARAVIEIAPGARQGQRLNTLPARTGGIGRLLSHPVGAAEHDARQQHQHSTKPIQPTQRQGTSPRWKYGRRVNLKYLYYLYNLGLSPVNCAAS